jgi:hypothetical protein
MSVCCECCVLSGRGLCDELITGPEETYRLGCVVVCDLETSWMRRPWPNGGCSAKNKNSRILNPIMQSVGRLGSAVGIATGYGLDGPVIEFRWGASFSVPVQTNPGVHPASCTMGTGVFPGVKSGRGVTLTPHHLLVPWSWKSIATPLLPLWAVRPVQNLSACTRVQLTFIIQSGTEATWYYKEHNCILLTQCLHVLTIWNVKNVFFLLWQIVWVFPRRLYLLSYKAAYYRQC